MVRVQARQRSTDADHETGIQDTPFGYRAFIRVKGTLYSKRFSSDTSKTAIRDWRAAQRTDALRAHRTRTGLQPQPGTFAEDIAEYLSAVKAMPTYAERQQHLEHWIAALGGTRKRESISGPEIRTVLQQWKLTGKAGQPLSESACNHRRTALMHFFTVMNGKSGSNPVKDVPRFREPDPEPRGLTFPELRKVFAKMPESATKARVLVMATTGLPPATLMRLTPSSIDYKAKAVTVPRRRKGKGTKTRTLPLTPDAIRAFRLLDRFEAWGTFSRDALRHSLQNACRRAKMPVIRGYDLRHSFATATYQASGDIRAVQELLDHSDAKLTARYTIKAVDSRLRSALHALRKVAGEVTTKRKQAKKRAK